MKFKMYHECYNVLDLEKSLKFYKEAFGFTEKRVLEASDGSYKLVFIGNDESDFTLELTWIKDMDRPYNLGDEEFHLGIQVDDFEAAHKLHESMGIIAMENPDMGIYFVKDPDGYWLEVVPHR